MILSILFIMNLYIIFPFTHTLQSFDDNTNKITLRNRHTDPPAITCPAKCEMKLLVSYPWAYETSTGCLEIDWSQPRHETALWWRNKGPVTSTSTEVWDLFFRVLNEIYGHVDVSDKEFMTPRYRRLTPVKLCLINFILMGLGFWWKAYIILHLK